MKIMKSIMMAGATSVILASAAHAADLPTKKTPPVEKPNCFASFMTWLDSTAGDCPLSLGPVTVYGQIDVGGGYQTNAAPFNAWQTNGVNSLISKQSNGGQWQGVPNGLSQSNVGAKFKQKIYGDISLIGDINFGFDPYSLQFANGPQSLASQNAVPQFFQQSNADSSRAGTVWNSRYYLGFTSPTYGTFTAGRIYTFSNTLASLYDFNGGAVQFGLIGNSSSAVNGLGLTELARYNTGASYVYDYQKIVHAGAAVQFGSFQQNNGSAGAYQVNVGGNYMGFSVDGIYSYVKDGIALSNYGGNGGLFGLPKGVNQSDLKATLADVNSFAIMAKYQWFNLPQLTLYGGYDNNRFSNPSDSYAWGISSVAGGYAVLPSGVTNTAYTINRVTQIAWAGAKYALLPNLDVSGGWYEIFQNNYDTAPATNCVLNSSLAKPATISGSGGTLISQGTVKGDCSGQEPIAAFLIDYRPWKRVDTYAGVMWSNVSGGLASGYMQTNNTALTAGVRLSF